MDRRSMILGLMLSTSASAIAGSAMAGLSVGSAPGKRNGDPPIGLGLDGIADWATQTPFIDLMKSGRPWTGHMPGRDWGGMEQADLEAAGHLDEHGWPKTIPRDVTGVSTLMLTDFPAEAHYIRGRYRITYEGEGSIYVDWAETVSARPGEIWIDNSAGSGGFQIVLQSTDPAGTGDYIRNIVVVKEENIAAYEAGATFNPRWTRIIGDMRLVRFMNWMMTNDSSVSSWDQRPQPSDYTFGRRGAPVEIMVQLANELGMDPWFTMPHLADDNYVRRFAIYVRDHLDGHLKAHVEFSNEVWNWQFGQAKWAEDQATLRWGQSGAWMQYYGVRAAEIARIWTEIYADEAAARLVRVVATHTGWLGLEHDLLAAPLFVAEAPEKRPPAEIFDAYAVTGYFGGNLGEEPLAPIVKRWIASSRASAEAGGRALGLAGDALHRHVADHRFDAAISLALAEIGDGSVVGLAHDTVAKLLGEVFPYHADVARRHGLNLIMYEGGTHIVGLGPWIDDEELTEFFVEMNYSPAMGALYSSLFEGWKAAGGTLFNVFVDVGMPTKWGSWGALRHLDDHNPRWDAITAFNRSTPAWWETRAPGSFAGRALDRQTA